MNPNDYWHLCHFCGTAVNQNGYEVQVTYFVKEKRVTTGELVTREGFVISDSDETLSGWRYAPLHVYKRHWLSDCRPDLVKHEIGPKCTWRLSTGEPLRDGARDNETCYAYQTFGFLGADAKPQYGQVWTTEHVHFYQDGPT